MTPRTLSIDPAPGRARPRRPPLAALLVPALLLAWVAPALAALPVIAPGTRHAFAENEDGLVIFDTPPEIRRNDFFLIGFCGTNGGGNSVPGEQRLRALAEAANNAGRSTCIVYGFNDFEIPAGANPEAVLMAHISASIKAKGFLALFSVGQARMEVTLRVRDITGEADPLTEENPSYLATQQAFEKEISGLFNPSLGIDVGALIPVPDGKVGVSVGGEVTTALQVFNEDTDVALDVLLQRGHRYRIELEMTASVKMGLMVGFGLVNFFRPEAPPDLFDRERWQESLNSLFSMPVPDESTAIGLPKKAPIDFVAHRALDLFNLGKEYSFPDVMGIGAKKSINSILDDIGMPRLQFTKLLDAFAKPERPVEEFLEGNGVEMTALSVTVQPDLAEAIEELRRVSCDLERLVHTPQGQRASDIAVCGDEPTFPFDFPEIAPPGRAASDAPEPGRSQGLGRGQARGRAAAYSPPGVGALLPPGDLSEALYIERQLLEGKPSPLLYLPAEKGGRLEQVRGLVWSTIDSQFDLGLAVDRAETANELAAEADRRLQARDFLGAFNLYGQAYRQLIPAL